MLKMNKWDLWCQNQTPYLLLLNINNDLIETWLKSKYIAMVIHINNEMPKSNIKFIPIQNKFVIDHVCFVLFIVCLCICICERLIQNNNHKTKHKNNTNCGSAFEPGASGPPYYCTSICVRSWCNWRASLWIPNPKKKRIVGMGWRWIPMPGLMEPEESILILYSYSYRGRGASGWVSIWRRRALFLTR